MCDLQDAVKYSSELRDMCMKSLAEAWGHDGNDEHDKEATLVKLADLQKRMEGVCDHRSCGLCNLTLL